MPNRDHHTSGIQGPMPISWLERTDPETVEVVLACASGDSTPEQRQKLAEWVTRKVAEASPADVARLLLAIL